MEAIKEVNFPEKVIMMRCTSSPGREYYQQEMIDKFRRELFNVLRQRERLKVTRLELFLPKSLI